MCGNYFAYVAILIYFHDHDIKAKITRFELGIRLAMGPVCTKFGESL